MRASLIVIAVAVMLQAPPPPRARAADPAEAGRRLFETHCLECHGPTGEGGVGGDIRGLDRAIIGRAIGGIEQMPAFDLAPSEIEALVAHLKALAAR